MEHSVNKSGSGDSPLMTALKGTFVLISMLIVLSTLTACWEEETPSEKVGNAAEEVGEGMEEGTEELGLKEESTGDKIGDAVEEMTE